jgi:hypothetical protein
MPISDHVRVGLVHWLPKERLHRLLVLLLLRLLSLSIPSLLPSLMLHQLLRLVQSRLNPAPPLLPRRSLHLQGKWNGGLAP